MHPGDWVTVFRSLGYATLTRDYAILPMLGRSYWPMLAMLSLPYTGYAHAILCWRFILAYSDSNTQDRRDRRGTAAGTAASPPAKGRRAAPSAAPRGPAELAPAVPRAVRGRSAGGPKGGLRRGF